MRLVVLGGHRDGLVGLRGLICSEIALNDIYRPEDPQSPQVVARRA